MNVQDQKLVKALREADAPTLYAKAASRIEELSADLLRALDSNSDAYSNAEQARAEVIEAENRVVDVCSDVRTLVNWALAAGADPLDVRVRLSAAADEVVRTAAMARSGS